MNPRVTVLMPVYNRDQYLSESIESILTQTFKDFEFIIIDDFSTDGSCEIVNKYAQEDSRIRLLRNRNIKGIVGAINTGIEEAKGEYIARMDSDDICLPERLERQVVFLDNNPHIGACGTWVKLFGKHRDIIWELPTDDGTIRSTMLFCGAIANPTGMIRRRIFSEYAYDDSFVIGEDLDFWTRIEKTTKLANVPEILLLYRTHDNNSMTMYSDKDAEMVRRIHLRQLKELGISPSNLEVELHEKLSRSQYETSKRFIRQASSWLNKLTQSNTKTECYPEPAFSVVIDQKRREVNSRVLETSKEDLEPDRKDFISLIKRILKAILPKKIADLLHREVLLLIHECKVEFDKTEKLRVRLGLCTKLSKTVKKDFKIGMAMLAHERPEYLELCLDSLFKTNLYNYNITFLIQDDGSMDPRVREIIERERDPKYRIVRSYTTKGENSWGAAFNKAIEKLLEIDDFDIIGSCDSDALFHPEWLDKTLKICLWAKKNHPCHVLGPFSSFNSSDYEFHRILGNYASPEGNYVIKVRMGALNYLYFKEDLLKLGFFEEHKDDETMMTVKFQKMGVRNFCTETSYVEHIGHSSVLNQWRPTPVERAVYGMNLAEGDWGIDMEKVSPYGYYKYLKRNDGFGAGRDIESDVGVDVVIPAIRKDLDVLPLTVVSVRKYLKHPIGNIYIVGPRCDELIEFSKQHHCIFKDEDSVLPIKVKDINYTPKGADRSGWIFQQLLKLSADVISDKKYAYVIDADTVLVQPQKFEQGNKTILLVSDEYHFPYSESFKKIFKYVAPAPFSFVSHQMIFDVENLKELRTEIEHANNNRSWYQVILNNLDLGEESSFSEYETYGNWMMKNHPETLSLEYWFNKSLPKAAFRTFRLDDDKYKEEYRSVSFHSYCA